MLAIVSNVLALSSPLLSRPETLFDWARSNGAFVSESLSVSAGCADSSRGLVLSSCVPKGAVLVTLPRSMQLGVDSISARDCPDEAAGLTSDLAVIPRSMWNARLGVALLAEKELGSVSPFAAYIAELPARLSCALAPQPNGFGSASAPSAPEPPASGRRQRPALAAWPPSAGRVSRMRAALESLHSKLASPPRAPSSLRDLCWAAAIAGSRAYRVRGAPRDDGADAARLLPVIDLANYAPAGECNAELRNSPSRSQDAAGGSDDPLAVSLYATRDLAAGSEVLIDYGGGKSLSNERLLLEYGFVLPDLATDELALEFGAIAFGLNAVAASAEEARTETPTKLSEAEAGELSLHVARLLPLLGDVENEGLRWHAASGVPTDATRGVALLLTARYPSELAPHGSLKSLCSSSPSPEHRARAERALTSIAEAALDQVEAEAARWSTAVEGEGDDEDAFDVAARRYVETRRGALRKAILWTCTDGLSGTSP
jgi:hypothetical protein